MALVIFQDSNGEGWRAWDVRPARAGADAGAAVTHLGSLYGNGWLCFERLDGGDRRRLIGFPDEWEKLAHAQLEHLCRTAIPVLSRPTSTLASTADERPAYRPGISQQG